MPHTVRTNSHRRIPTEDVEDARDLAAAAVDADLQLNHRLLLCLEQTRRAQIKLARDWIDDLRATGRMLPYSSGAQRWMLVPAGLSGSAWTHFLAAQGTVLAAWTEFRHAGLDEMRASLRVAECCVWPYGIKTDVGGHPALVTASWLEEAMKTYEKFAVAAGAALSTGSAGAAASH